MGVSNTNRETGIFDGLFESGWFDAAPTTDFASLLASWDSASVADTSFAALNAGQQDFVRGVLDLFVPEMAGPASGGALFAFSPLEAAPETVAADFLAGIVDDAFGGDHLTWWFDGQIARMPVIAEAPGT